MYLCGNLGSDCRHCLLYSPVLSSEVHSFMLNATTVFQRHPCTMCRYYYLPHWRCISDDNRVLAHCAVLSCELLDLQFSRALEIHSFRTLCTTNTGPSVNTPPSQSRRRKHHRHEHTHIHTLILHWDTALRRAKNTTNAT